MVICLERSADLHMAQLMPLPLTVSCFSESQIDFTFLVPAHPGSPGQRAVKRVYVCARSPPSPLWSGTGAPDTRPHCTLDVLSCRFQGRLNQWAHWARAQGPRIFFLFEWPPTGCGEIIFLKLIILLPSQSSTVRETR